MKRTREPVRDGLAEAKLPYEILEEIYMRIDNPLTRIHFGSTCADMEAFRNHNMLNQPRTAQYSDLLERYRDAMTNDDIVTAARATAPDEQLRARQFVLWVASTQPERLADATHTIMAQLATPIAIFYGYMIVACGRLTRVIDFFHSNNTHFMAKHRRMFKYDCAQLTEAMFISDSIDIATALFDHVPVITTRESLSYALSMAVGGRSLPMFTFIIKHMTNETLSQRFVPVCMHVIEKGDPPLLSLLITRVIHSTGAPVDITTARHLYMHMKSHALSHYKVDMCHTLGTCFERYYGHRWWHEDDDDDDF